MPSYKGLLLGYDEIVLSPESEGECQYCLKHNQVEAILALLQPYAWVTRWYSETGQTIVQDDIEAFVDDVGRRLMTDCCSGATRLAQFTSDGTFQTSYDGGTTWVDTPSDDPRNGITYPPPLAGTPGDTLRCEAANHVTGYLQTVVEAIGVGKDNDAASADLIAILIGILVALGFILTAWLWPLLGGLVAVIAANYDATSWRAAFTSSVWQFVVNKLYCNMEDDGTLTEAGWNTLLIDLEAGLTGIAKDFIVSWIRDTRHYGVNSMARQVAYDAELDCFCSCGDGYSAWTTYGGTVVDSGDGYIEIQATNGFDGTYRTGVSANVPTSCCYITWTVTSGANNGAIYWNTCAEGHHDPLLHTGLHNSGQTDNDVIHQSSIPFTMKYMFGPLP